MVKNTKRNQKIIKIEMTIPCRAVVLNMGGFMTPLGVVFFLFFKGFIKGLRKTAKLDKTELSYYIVL